MVENRDGRGRATLRWGAVRVVLYAGLFVALLAASELALPAALDNTNSGLLLGSALTLGAAFVAAAVLLLTLDRRTVGALGLAWTPAVPKELALGFGIGVGSIALTALIMYAAGGLRYTAQPGDLRGWAAAAVRTLGMLAVPAFAEEVLFRGYAFQATARVTGPLAATVAGSALFAAVHANNPSVGPLGFVNIFLAGVLLSAAYLKTRSLWFAGALHLGWNWGMAGPLDLPVSGIELFDAPLYDPVLHGSRWLTGGMFGPEGGVAGTIAFVTAILIVWRLRSIRESPAMKALRPIVDVAETDEKTGTEGR